MTDTNTPQFNNSLNGQTPTNGEINAINNQPTTNSLNTVNPNPNDMTQNSDPNQFSNQTMPSFNQTNQGMQPSTIDAVAANTNNPIEQSTNNTNPVNPSYFKPAPEAQIENFSQNSDPTLNNTQNSLNNSESLNSTTSVEPTPVQNDTPSYSAETKPARSKSKIILILIVVVGLIFFVFSLIYYFLIFKPIINTPLAGIFGSSTSEENPQSEPTQPVVENQDPSSNGNTNELDSDQFIDNMNNNINNAESSGEENVDELEENLNSVDYSGIEVE